MNSLIDTHAHLYLEEFDNDRDLIRNRAKQSRIDKVLLPAINSESHNRLFELSEYDAALFLPMMGLHPCYVNEAYEAELESVKSLLHKRQFIAIGEIGLDLYWSDKFYEEQKQAFTTQLKWAIDYNLPVSIHSRNANAQAIEIVKTLQTGQLSGVFHCFSGSVEEAKEIIGLGFYLGIGGVVTFKKSGLDTVLAEVGAERIVLETDAPYLAPVPFRGKRNESSYIVYVVKKLSEIFNITAAEVSEITTGNAKKLFRI